IAAPSTALRGTVSAQAPAGNTYTSGADARDGPEGDRFVALVSIAAHALAAGNKIDLTFPTTSSAIACPEDFRAVSGIGQSFGTGSAGCTSFSSGPVTTSATELMVGGLAVESGAGSWVTGWTALAPVLGTGGDT